MSEEIDFDQILGKYHSDPYEYVDILTEHTGTVRFLVEKGSDVAAVSGEWKHIPGTALFEITRERNTKKNTAMTNGVVSEICSELQGSFVEAGEKLMTIRHPLKKKEIIERILQEVLHIFPSPERAKYFFTPDIQSRIKKKGAREISVKSGDEIIIMSLMKRDTPVYYNGEPGVIHSVYFQPGVSVDQGAPLIGVCPIDKLPIIQKIITRVKADWDQQPK